MRPQGRADQADGGPIDRRRAGCLTSCSGVTKNRHWSIQTFSFSDAEVDAEWDMIDGYARVSTDTQDLAIQLDTLRAAGCEKVFHDKESGDSADRPQLKRLMKRLSADDVVKAPATDRFARDPTDLLVLGRDIRTKGARFVSTAEPIVDTDSEFWELVAACFGIAAKFELRRIRERTAAGRAGGEVRAQAKAYPAPEARGLAPARRGR